MSREAIYTYNVLPKHVKPWADECLTHLRKGEDVSWIKTNASEDICDLLADPQFRHAPTVCFTCRSSSGVIGVCYSSKFTTDSMKYLYYDEVLAYSPKNDCSILPTSQITSPFAFVQTYISRREFTDFLLGNLSTVINSIVTAQTCDAEREYHESTYDDFGFWEKD